MVAVVIAVALLALQQAAAGAGKSTTDISMSSELIPVLKKAQKATIAGLGTISCDYRAESGGKLMMVGRLTVDLSSLSGLEAELPGFQNWVPLIAPTMRLDVKDWPGYASHVPPGSPKWDRLVTNSNIIWLVSTDGAAKQSMIFDDAAKSASVFGGVPATLRYSYLAPALETDYPYMSDTTIGNVGHNAGSATIGGRPCEVYLFDWGKQGGDEPADSYKVWLDSKWRMPLREEKLSKGRIVEWQTFSDYIQLSPGVYGARRCAGNLGGTDDVTLEEDFGRFGPSCLLPKEFRVKANGAPMQRVRFSNWRKVTVPKSFFVAPPGAKEVK